MDMKTVVALVRGRLKLCSSEDKMKTEINADVKKHLGKLKRQKLKQNREQQVTKKLSEVQAGEVENQAKSKNCEATAAKLPQNKDDLVEEQRKARKPPPLSISVEKARPRKKCKKNDCALLDTALTPREKAESLGTAWAPPTLVETTGRRVAYSPPGESWKQESTKKLFLLGQLRSLLTAAGLLEPPMTFNRVMAIVGADDGFDFNGRVFIYLVALIIKKKRCVTLCIPTCGPCTKSTGDVNRSHPTSSSTHSHELTDAFHL